VISAAVIVPPSVGAIWLGGWEFVALILLALALLAAEWGSMCRLADRPYLPVTGFLWMALAAFALLWLRADPEAGRVNVLFAALVVWASDIGAYAAGRLIGGPRLAPSLSPAKTWAGAGGGLAAAVVVGSLIGFAAQGARAIPAAGVAAVLLGVASQLGDLSESAAKRRLGVKDSGRLIPGHGGLLDRVDGLLAASPVAALLAFGAGRGVMLWS
jgi:phosphatidate cytidylyltransferase